MYNLLKRIWFLSIAFFFTATCKQTENRQENINSENAVISSKKDSFDVNTQTPVTGLSNTDVQYLDLMIPQDAMVEIYYNGDPTELPYIDALKKYIETKHTTITVFKTKNFPLEVKPAGRLYIHDTGDHRYVLYIF